PEEPNMKSMGVSKKRHITPRLKVFNGQSNVGAFVKRNGIGTIPSRLKAALERFHKLCIRRKFRLRTIEPDIRIPRRFRLEETHWRKIVRKRLRRCDCF